MWRIVGTVAGNLQMEPVIIIGRFKKLGREGQVEHLFTDVRIRGRECSMSRRNNFRQIG